MGIGACVRAAVVGDTEVPASAFRRLAQLQLPHAASTLPSALGKQPGGGPAPPSVGTYTNLNTALTWN
jgi:hypothetical protein